MTLVEMLDRPITFHRSFVRITASVSAAVYLSQSLFWTQRSPLPEGWFTEGREAWEEATGMDATKQARARKILLSLGVLEEQQGSLRVVSAELHKRLVATPSMRLMPKGRLTPEPKGRLLPPAGAVEAIYQIYPRKEGKGAAVKAINRALQRLSMRFAPPNRMEAAVEFLSERLGLYAKRTAGSDLKKLPHPATWMNQDRFDDREELWGVVRSDDEPEPEVAAPKGRGFKSPQQVEAERQDILARLAAENA